VGALSGAGTLITSANGLIVGWANMNSTFAGNIAGPFGTVKFGTGTFTLTGASSSTCVIGIVEGTLLVNGSTSGPVQAFGGTLGGTGTLGGPVTIDAGATLAPGLSPGIINTGNLNLAGVTLIEIEGTTPGTQYDNINVTGTVTIAGATLTLAGAHVPAPGASFTLITNDGADPVVGTFAGLPEGATVLFNGRTLTLSCVGGTGNDVVLSIAAAPGAAVAIPTLSDWVLLLLVMAMAVIGVGPASRLSRRKTRNA